MKTEKGGAYPLPLNSPFELFENRVDVILIVFLRLISQLVVGWYLVATSQPANSHSGTQNGC